MRDIADARFQIEEIPGRPAGPVVSAVPPRRSRERLLWVAVTLALAGALIWSIPYIRSTPADMPEMRLEIASPSGADLSGFAISPDGRALVFQATVDGKTQLWLRPMDSETATPLVGTENVAVENGSVPFWSPDSRSVGFFAGGQLKRIDIAGGLVQALAEAPMNTRGGAWNAEGTIVFTRSATEPCTACRRVAGRLWPPPKSRRHTWDTAILASCRMADTSCTSVMALRRVRACTWARWTRKRRRVWWMPNQPRYSRRRTTCCSRGKAQFSRSA